MTGCVSKMPNFHAFTQTEKAKSNHLTSRKRPTLYILFDLAPPPLQARLNKVYLLICDCSRSWVCGHFHGRTGRCRWLLCHLRLVRRIFRGRKGPFSSLRRAVFTCAEERLRKKNAQILISKLCICAQMLHHVQLWDLMDCSSGGGAWQPIPVFLPGASHGQRSLAGYSLYGCKELVRYD